MDWNTKSLARVCALTGNPFQEGDRVISFILRGEGETLERLDYLEAGLTEQNAPVGEVLGRWTRVVAAQAESRKQAREQELAGAEEMFTALYAALDDTADEDRLALVQMLALTLERRRVLRAVGAAKKGIQPYLHTATKAEYSVKVAALTPEILLRIQPHLPQFAD